MNREEQFEILSDMFTYELDLNHYEIAFRAHYRMLNTLLDFSAEQMKEIDMPRVAYSKYYENVCLIFSQICLTVECMLKAILVNNGYSEEMIKKKNHNLLCLLDDIKSIDNDKIKMIYDRLHKHTALLKLFTQNKVFIDTRYMECETDMAVEHINIIWPLVLDIDEIYYEMYKDFNFINNVYPDSMVDDI